MVQTIFHKKPQTLLSAGNLFLPGSTNYIKGKQLILKDIFSPAMHAECGAYICHISSRIVRCAAI
jgi:hypothetical protein